MSNSSLIVHTRYSPNCNVPRTMKIDTIAIHCMAGNLTIESCGNMFAQSATAASSNYGIGSDGRIALYVDEANRSWCTSSGAVDNRAVTIEVASTSTHPYTVTDAAFESLIKLVADICKRNNIKQLLWKGDKSLVGQVDKQNMVVHRWMKNKACPGDYLYNLHPTIAERVNKLLEGDFLADMTEQEFNKVIDELKAEIKKAAPINYTYLEDIPEWGRGAVKDRVDRGVINGTGTDSEGRMILNISHDLMRMFVVEDNEKKLAAKTATTSTKVE